MHSASPSEQPTPSKVAAKKPPGLAIDTSHARLDRTLDSERRERARARREQRVRDHQRLAGAPPRLSHSPAVSMADPARPSDEIQLAEGDSSMAHSRHNEQQLDSDDEEHHSGNPYMQPHAHGHQVSQDGSLAQPYSHNAVSLNLKAKGKQCFQLTCLHSQQHQYSQHQQHYTDHHYTDADIHQSHIHSTGDAQYGSDDEEDDEDDDMDEDHDESSELELPEAEEDIDYDVVYALHTFLATVEGQASVVKGDQLTLLDDSNSYWWLVRVLKTQLVGYIPAENIETPEERLARFYKKQNLNVGPTS